MKHSFSFLHHRPRPLFVSVFFLISMLVGACGSESTTPDSNDSETTAPITTQSPSAVSSAPQVAASTPVASTTTPSTTTPSTNTSVATSNGECNDGIDNDGDGLVDWQFDVGCWGADDATERSGSRSQENGWTTFDLSADSRVIYVSASEGSDSNNGLSPQSAVATPERGSELVRDGFPDFLLLKRGDVWRDTTLSRFKSGRSKREPMVIGSYGYATERPRLEVTTQFLNDNGQARRYLAVTGLAISAYRKDPSNVNFDGTTGGAFRYVSSSHSRDLLFEDNYVEYAEFVVQNTIDVELRRNVVYRSYHIGTCAYNADGSPNLSGNSTHRPSGIYAGGNDGLLLEDNVFDQNGWNPDVPDACATIYNHNMYLADNKRVVIKNNILLRASSIGLKLTANKGFHSTDDLLIENNLFVEGEIGISIGGNTKTEYRFSNVTIKNNVLTNIGRHPPTKRELSWYIDVQDNDNTVIAGNYLLHSPTFSNTFGVYLNGGTNRNVVVSDNIFYGIHTRSLFVKQLPTWSDVSVRSNTIIAPGNQPCMIDHRGDFSTVSYVGNHYYSAANDNSWFCYANARQSLGQWMTDANETGAEADNTTYAYPDRNLESYGVEQGVGSSLDAVAAELRKQSKYNYRPALTADAINRYIRQGYQ
jgi:hypothetical protein